VTNTTLLVLLALAIAAAVAWRWTANGPSRAESQLVRLCRGNVEQAERLLNAELTRSPGISRSEAASRAIGRYERDNR
jgi:hypothetical protein